MKRQLDHIINKIEIQSTGSEAQSNELAKVINSVICYFEFIIMMFRVTNRLCTADCIYKPMLLNESIQSQGKFGFDNY